MKLATAAQMKELDRKAIEDRCIPSTLLMSRAADGLASAVKAAPTGDIAILCGSGNNGGDGICLAGKLLTSGYTVRAFFTGNPEKMTADTKEMLRRLEEVGGRLESFEESEDILAYLSHSSVVIDAMLGTGLNAPLRGKILTAVRAVNASSAYVIAADIPTGIDTDTGAVLGDAVMADETVTFTFAKIGQFTEPGCVYCGKITLWNIGIPEDLSSALVSDTYALLPQELSLPRRNKLTHKGSFGRSFILAGSLGYTGAPVLAAEAAQRMGAGLVYLGVPDSIYSFAAIKCTEVIPQPVPCDEDGLISWDARGYIRTMLDSCQAALAGPGLGTSEHLQFILEMMIRNSTVPLVLDADGLNNIASDLSILKEAKAPLVLTPHPGEFARLGGSCDKGRIAGARDFAVTHGCLLVLKGHRTVIALPDGRVYLNTTGSPAMAKAGSGDVLAGMITALLGQGFQPETAVITAVYLHGLAGDICAQRLGEYSVIASDIIAAIGEAAKSISE
ncbi:MAG: NAD(P)H-hydrate dehydratase [Oscillospiraceae bacterium]|nr:NAD(P)H-hydrate dehydratase [Oscillospiraceae bacterium]